MDLTNSTFPNLELVNEILQVNGPFENDEMESECRVGLVKDRILRLFLQQISSDVQLLPHVLHIYVSLYCT